MMEMRMWFLHYSKENLRGKYAQSSWQQNHIAKQCPENRLDLVYAK